MWKILINTNQYKSIPINTPMNIMNVVHFPRLSWVFQHFFFDVWPSGNGEQRTIGPGWIRPSTARQRPDLWPLIFARLEPCCPRSIWVFYMIFLYDFSGVGIDVPTIGHLGLTSPQQPYLLEMIFPIVG